MNNHSASLYPFKALIKSKSNTKHPRGASISYLQILVLYTMTYVDLIVLFSKIDIKIKYMFYLLVIF
jgi:hypothetical protein